MKDEMAEQKQLDEDVNYDERNRDIVGFKREKAENLNAVKKLTTP
jgi:hypothetical protein